MFNHIKQSKVKQRLYQHCFTDFEINTLRKMICTKQYRVINGFYIYIHPKYIQNDTG